MYLADPILSCLSPSIQTYYKTKEYSHRDHSFHSRVAFNERANFEVIALDELVQTDDLLVFFEIRLDEIQGNAEGRVDNRSMEEGVYVGDCSVIVADEDACG